MKFVVVIVIVCAALLFIPEIHDFLKLLAVMTLLVCMSFGILGKLLSLQIKPCPKCNKIPDKMSYSLQEFNAFQGPCAQCGYKK